MNNTILTVLGTRPEIIKMSPLIPLFDKNFDNILIHTGQHYSANMDSIFFEELGIREPDFKFESGGLSSVSQVAKIMCDLESIVEKLNPSAMVVHGDTNTTLAGAMVGAKYKSQGLKVFHVEAGCRSHNLSQAEEINRLIVDRVSDYMFVPTERDSKNLISEGYSESTFEVTGNTVVDSCVRMAKSVNTKSVLEQYNLKSREYVLLTMHRQETVDDREKLLSMIQAIDTIADQVNIVFPLHPRTKKMMGLNNIYFKNPSVKIIEPVGYATMIALVKEAMFCMTDSGGLQEESATLKTPTIVLRNETEYQHYIDAGFLFLTGIDPGKILRKAKDLLRTESTRPDRFISEVGNGSSLKIINKLKSILL